MDITINTLSYLYKNLQHLPAVAVRDIEQRITDWMASGGSADDAYIKQQFRYAEMLINWRKGV